MRSRVGLCFAAMCLLAGSVWMIDQFYPPVLSGTVRVAVQDGVLALVFAIVTRLQRKPVRLGRGRWLELTLSGAALLALPSIVSAGAAGKVSDLDSILCYALIPVIVVFLLGQSSPTFGAQESPMRLLVPALAGLGGAALLLQFTVPRTLAGDAWLLAMVASAIASAYAAIRLYRALEGAAVMQQCAILCAAASVFASVFYRLGYAPIEAISSSAILVGSLRTLLLEGPILLLLVYLLREMSPIAISTRMLLIPLVTLVEGYLIERPSVAWTSYAGALLMATASLILLRAEEPERTPQITDVAL